MSKDVYEPINKRFALRLQSLPVLNISALDGNIRANSELACLEETRGVLALKKRLGGL